MKNQKTVHMFTETGSYSFKNVIEILVKDQNGKIVFSTITKKDLEQKPLKRR